MLKKEIFRTGTHTDSKGQTSEWTAEKLDAIVANFNAAKAQNKNVPVVIGHPKTDSPAWGWVSNITREGEVLVAEFNDIVPEFKQLLDAKQYRNVSISLTPDLHLNHVGFLGAVQPAVKGLADVQFNTSDESFSLEYAEPEPQQQTAAKKEEPQTLDGLILSIEKAVRDKYSAELAQSVVNTIKDMITSKSQQKQFSEESPEAKQMRERIEALEKKNRDLEFEQYFAQRVTAGYLIPAQKKAFRTVYDATVSNNDFTQQNENLLQLEALVTSFPKHNLTTNFAQAGSNVINPDDEIKNDIKQLFGDKR